MLELHGQGSSERTLTRQEIFELCQEAFENSDLDGKRILAIIPDLTRTAPLDVIFPIVHKLLSQRVEQLDFIIALGTHPPLSEAQIYRRVGITAEEHRTKYPQVRFFNHEWNSPGQLQSIGTISEEEVVAISGGRMRQTVDVRVNKMIHDYDLLFIIGPTFPHEVVGFSGGNKYIFPGIAGQEIIDMFHWLGALITSPVIIGTRDTPVRQIVERAAAFVPVPRLCMSLVVKKNKLAGLYIGSPEEAWRAAADLSKQVHIIYKDKPFQRVLSCAPEMYGDMWTGAKCAYKLEPVVADGGELIIYAPHITQVSVMHGEMIEQIGYHVRDYFVKQMSEFEHIPTGILAHSTHLKGAGTFENGVEKPRINVTLATGIPEEVCRRINVGYRDPDTIEFAAWQNREDEGILFVPTGGEILYRLRKDSAK